MMKAASRVTALFVTSVAILALLAPASHAAPLFAKDVFCGTTKCGTMEFDKYEEFSSNSTFADKFWLGGVSIHGVFKRTRSATYHYIQSDRNDGDDFRWINDASVALPQPFIDPPPGGYKVRADATDNAYTNSQAFDYLPWYDQGEFPDFGDSPSGFFLSAKNQADKTLTNTFETWLVCVIDEKQGPDANKASDDSYKVAPLLGWQWGYDITYKKVTPAGAPDDFSRDYTVKKRDFAFVMAPTAHWTDALGAKYGAGAKQDFWNITTDSCEKCGIPEPSTIVLMVSGLTAIGLRFRRRFT